MKGQPILGPLLKNKKGQPILGPLLKDKKGQPILGPLLRMGIPTQGNPKAPIRSTRFGAESTASGKATWRLEMPKSSMEGQNGSAS